MVRCPACNGNSSSPYVCTECGAALPPSMAPGHAPVSRPPANGNPARVSAPNLRPVAAPVIAQPAGSHGLSPAELLELRHLDRAVSRRRVMRQFLMASAAIIIMGTVVWILVYSAAHRRDKIQVKFLPPEVKTMLAKRKHNRADVATLASFFYRLGTESDSAILKSGIARNAIAADYKERWVALEAARLLLGDTIPSADLALMEKLHEASLHLGNYLDSFSGWKPDEKGDELHLALGGFQRVSQDALNVAAGQ